jgi:hypothetical protein
MKKKLLILVILFSFSGILIAQQEDSNTDLTAGDTPADPGKTKVDFSYGGKGWQMELDDRFLMSLEFRLQFRTLLDSNPDENTFNVQRARMKVDGYAFQHWLEYFMEFDFRTPSLLNFEFTLAKLDELQFKLGQWKISYNTERFISSGKQQFVDRTISNRFFTFDRQIGIMVQGDLFKDRIGCTSYRLGIFNGDGRMNVNNNGKFLYFGRLQWNFSRKVMKMSFGDLARVEKPEGFIAFSAVWNESPYTSFTTGGAGKDSGGQLPGYDQGTVIDEWYLLRQMGFELMFKYRGFSLMSENHVKSIDDRSAGGTLGHSLIYGGYVMAGFFPGEFIGFMPDPLEIVFRYSLVSNTLYSEMVSEYGVALNWYFSGHRNKLTTDVSYLENDVSGEDSTNLTYSDHIRFRFQWDVSF